MSDNKYSIKKCIIYLSIVFFIFLHVLEITYRIYQYIILDVPIISVLHNISTNEVDVSGAITMAKGHPLMHYVLNPEKLSHTEDYFRVTDDVPFPKKYIVCMGGSSTYGTRVSARDAYPNQLQKFLNVKNKKYKVLNAGVPGWSMPHQLARYIYDIRLRQTIPDMLILYVGYNDTWGSLLNDQTLPAHSESLKLFRDEKPLWMSYRFLIWLFSKTELLTGKEIVDNSLNDFAFKKGVPPPEGINKKNLVRFQKEFDLLLKIAKMDNIRVLAVLQDTNGKFSWHLEKKAFELLREEIRKISLENSVYIVDMHEITHSKPEYFADTIHMTKLGNEVRGKHLAEIVSNILKD